MSIETIVVAVDFSPNSDLAVDEAMALARTFDAKLHVAHAFHFPIRFVTPYEVAIPDTYIEDSQNAARQKLDEVTAKIRASGIEAEPHMLEVPAAQAIAECARELSADLIVMGTHGYTGLKHAILGSTAERTLRLAPCSVLTVKQPAPAAE